MKTEVLVIGGGHAGIEAAHTAAQCGVSAMLVTAHVDLVGQMSCNPAIGGIAKGTIVREIDALGGLMGRITDKAGIQFRMLNKSKGAAVWGPRAQADKALYRTLCRKCIEETGGLDLFQAMVTEILVKDNTVCGVVCESGERIEAKAVVLAMGTFLNGLAHIGMTSFSCGRLGESASLKLSESLQKHGIAAGRLKTGTPARIDGRSVDVTKMAEQKGDEEPWPFSFSTREPLKNKAVCWELRTTEKTHDIIRKNLDKSPLYGGKIVGIGPRYCPSIEDKVIRFGDRHGHTLFLEPEGLETHEMYLNGFSTSLPFEVQCEMIHSLVGLENAKIIRPAYAIEYDYFFPVQLKSTLESKKVEKLYFAGQINGTSGYEEAACQGLIAGLNAAKKVRGEEEVVLGRETSYTGVLIDDLVTKGTEEPYRMFTSRAEYRLLFRQDNVDERLMPIAARHGLCDKELLCERQEVWAKRAELKNKLKTVTISPEMWTARPDTSGVKQKTTAAELLKRPEVTLREILSVVSLEPCMREDMVTVEADIKYEGFIVKQKEEIQRQKKIEEVVIPEDINYLVLEGMLTESRTKLQKTRPRTLGQASRIAGVTPADISVLIMNIFNKKQKHVSRET
jgi:tRNA uridine 5-carboxymethylaminomethyl modification enzyme